LRQDKTPHSPQEGKRSRRSQSPQKASKPDRSRSPVGENRSSQESDACNIITQARVKNPTTRVG
jgi:hypothetical protein